jgi:hypothetical protein
MGLTLVPLTVLVVPLLEHLTEPFGLHRSCDLVEGLPVRTLKYMPVIRKLVIIAFAVLILTPPAGANVAERFFSLSRNSKQLWDNISNLEKRSNNPNEKDCLFSLISELDVIELRLDALGTLVGLASDMNDFSDEQMVLREVRQAAKEFTSHLEIERKFVSKICSWSKAVSAEEPRNLRIWFDFAAASSFRKFVSARVSVTGVRAEGSP